MAVAVVHDADEHLATDRDLPLQVLAHARGKDGLEAILER